MWRMFRTLGYSPGRGTFRTLIPVIPAVRDCYSRSQPPCNPLCNGLFLSETGRNGDILRQTSASRTRTGSSTLFHTPTQGRLIPTFLIKREQKVTHSGHKREQKVTHSGHKRAPFSQRMTLTRAPFSQKNDPHTGRGTTPPGYPHGQRYTPQGYPPGHIHHC